MYIERHTHTYTHTQTHIEAGATQLRRPKTKYRDKMMDEEKLFVILYYTPYTHSGHIYKDMRNNTVDEGL